MSIRATPSSLFDIKAKESGRESMNVEEEKGKEKKGCRDKKQNWAQI